MNLRGFPGDLKHTHTHTPSLKKKDQMEQMLQFQERFSVEILMGFRRHLVSGFDRFLIDFHPTIRDRRKK